MSRRIASAAGAMLLAGLGSWASPAFSQGPMAPRMDVAPPPRVAPPPPPVVVPPTVVPTPPPMPVAPVMAPPAPTAPAPKTPTASAPTTPTPAAPAPATTPNTTPTATPAPPPATASPQTPRATASAPSPYTDSQVKALSGVGVGVSGPGGQRQVTSDSNGVVSLGKLGPGRHELTVNRKSLGTGTSTGTQPGGQPVALIALLLPAVQGIRYLSTNVPPVNDPDDRVQIKVEVDAGGRVARIDWGGGKASINVTTGDFNGDGRADIKLFDDLSKRNTSGETRLVFVTPIPGSTAAALADANAASTTRLGTSPGNPTGPGTPIPNNSNNPIPGIDVVVQKKPAGNAITQTTGGDGQTTFRQLEPGNYDVALPKVPGGGAVSMTTFVNGQEASRADFPVGSSTGQFSVRNAQDTITLKFESATGPAPASRMVGAPTGPGTPTPNYQNNPIPGIDVVVQKKPAGNAITQTTGGDGTSTLGVLTPGTHSVALDTKKLLDVRIPGPSGSEPAQPAGILIGLLLPAVQKLGEAPLPTTVEHFFPLSLLANARELRIDIVIPEGGGSPKVDWGDGSPTTDVGRDGVPVSSALRISADVSTLRVSALSSLDTGPGGPGAPTAAKLDALTDGLMILRFVGATATGPGGVMQARSDGEGWTRFGKLPIGNTVIEFNGADLASALKTTGAPLTSTAQQNHIELLVVIAIIAIKTDGTPVVFTGSVPASAVKTLKADLRIGRDGNAMAVDWGNGPQLPQVLPRTGAASLTVPGPNGPIPLDPAVVKSLQDRAGGSAPGLVESNTLLQKVSTTRLGTSPGNPAGPGTPIPNYQNAPIPGIDIVVQKKPAGNAITQTTGGDGTSTLGVLTPGTHSVVLDTKKLLDLRLPGPSGSEPAQPAGILIGLLLPAVQKVGEAPQPTTVEHSFPRSFLANARELRIDIVIPDGGGSPKVNWGDGSPTTDVGRDGVAPSLRLRIAADVSTLRVSALSTPDTGPGGPGTPTAAKLDALTDGLMILRFVGATATGPGGVMQARSDGEGWTRFGKLPIGNTVIEFNGADLASALKTTGAPLAPTAQQNQIELLVVIAIIAIKTDGTPVVFTGSVPASAVKTLKADLRIGRDGNAMEANWGNGQQLPQILPKTGTASLTVPGPNGPIPLDPAVVKSLQDRAAGSAPGLVEANNILMDVSTPR